jgi:hypothetical protein
VAAKKDDKPAKRKQATTPDAKEGQMISLAVDLAEKQLADGTATSQVITHYLKLGTSRERLEQERLENENRLLDAKVGQIESMQRVEELYAEALLAMKTYSGANIEYDEYDELDEG